MGKNKLRNGKRKSAVIISYTIILLIMFAIGMYIAYIILNFMDVNQIDDMTFDHCLDFFEFFSSGMSGNVEVNFDTVKTMIVYQGTKLWWLYAGAILMVFMATSSTKDDYKGMEHGSASWADKYDEKDFKDNTGIPVGKNFYITVNNPKSKYYTTHNLNEITIGGSGAGKSFRKIEPDIMQMYGSYVVTDPKGELYRNTAKFLTENEYKIRVLNLIDVNLSNSYNPFRYMKEEQDVINVADLFMKNSAEEGEKADFWVGAAQDLLVAVMVYLWKTDGEIKSFGRVLRLVNSVRYRQGKIDPSCEIAQCFDMHKTMYPNDVVTVNWSSMEGTPMETMGSICKTLSTRLRLWATESVDELTASDEMDFDSIGVEKTVVFLIIPAARQTFKVIANIFYSQLFERLMYVANKKYNGRLPLLVSCELDEFPNIGKIPAFNETLAVVRSHNIRICIVLQGISQLKALYEKTWESIIGNCSIFTFLGTNDMDTKEYVSKRLGKTTVRFDTRSYSRNGGKSDSENYVQRDLLTADEIPRAIRPKGKTKRYGGSAIIFIDEYKPFFVTKYDTMAHKLFPITGSSYSNGIPNNTNIEVTYADIKKNRSDSYKQQVIDYFKIAEEKKAESEELLKQKALEMDKQEQEELKNKYENASELDESIIDFEDFEKSMMDEISEVSGVMDNFNFEGDENNV